MAFGPIAMFSTPCVLPGAEIPLEFNASVPMAIKSLLLPAAWNMAFVPMAMFCDPLLVRLAWFPNAILSFTGFNSPEKMLLVLKRSGLLSLVPIKCLVSSVPELPMILQLQSVSVLFKKFVAMVVAAVICPSAFTVTTGMESIAPYFLATTPVGFRSMVPFPWMSPPVRPLPAVIERITGTHLVCS